MREIENECRCMYSSRMTMCVPGSFIAESMKGKMILTFAARSRLNTISVCIFCVVCVCMLCAKCGFSPSSDFLAQTLDPSSVVVFCSASHVTYIFTAIVLHFSALHCDVSSNTGPAGI